MSRFEVNGSVVHKNSEKVLINNIPVSDGNHDGWDAKFGTQEESRLNSTARGRYHKRLEEELRSRTLGQRRRGS